MLDVPQLHDWLNRPHVAERWDNATTLPEVEKRYQTHLNSACVFPFIVELDGKPIGFIQSYNAELVGDGWWPGEPPGTWGVDQYLGEEGLLGKGIGSQFIRAFTDDLLKKSQVKRIITDPAPDNKRAIRAYEKAGFIGIGIVETPDGPAFLMEKYLTKEATDIRPIDKQNRVELENIFQLQQRAYEVEAKILRAKSFPPLKETIDDLKNSKDEGFVYIVGSVPVGAIFLEESESYKLISKLVIEPEFFRKGHARALVRHVLGLYPSAEFQVGTGAANDPALNLYKSLGFQIFSERMVEGNLKVVKLQRPAIIAETPRLLLRKIEENDFDALFKVLGDPEVMRFSLHGAENHDGVRKFLDATWKRYERDGVAQWAVVLKETGACIGECGISVQTIDGIKEYEIGYRLAKSHWGRGFATEAAKACRDFGFKQKGFSRLISIIEAKNQASIRVAEKVGMLVEKESTFHGIAVKIYSLEQAAFAESSAEIIR
jgi:RimJ/RimL family protein N-acetyltransferase